MFDFLEVAPDYAAGCSYTLQTHATKEGRVSKLHNSHMHKSTNQYHKLKLSQSTKKYQKELGLFMNFLDIFCVSLRPSINTSKDDICEQIT